MASYRQELAREAKVVGLRDFSTPSLEAVERRRWQLWTVAFVVMAALSAGLVLMASSGTASVGLFKHLPVRVGLVLLTMAFALYVLEKEVHLRRMTRLLLDERVLTAALSNRLKELAALVTVGKAVTSVLTPNQALDIILSSPLEVLGADGGAIILRDNPDELRAVCVRGNRPAGAARLAVGEGIAGYVAQQREPLLIAGPASKERFKNLVAQDPPVESALSVPLVNRDEVLGVLNVHAGDDRSFTEYDLRALGLFAEHAAVSIANGYLYEAERAHVNELLELDRLKSEFVATVRHEAGHEDGDRSLVRVSVLDRGSGIPVADAARVFDRFSRGATVTAPGMGLGLYLVKTLVERQGGRVYVTERPGGGAAFHVVLPASRARVEVQG